MSSTSLPGRPPSDAPRAHPPTDSGAVVTFARIGRPHGVRGGLRVWPFNPGSPLLAAPRQILVGPDAGGASRFELTGLRHDVRGVVIELAGVDSREAAERLNGALWFEPRHAFVGLDEPDEHYVVDLIGLKARTEEGALIGLVEDVIPGAGSDLLVVRDGPRRHLIPHVGEFVMSVDLGAREIVIRPIEGLLS